MAKKKAPTPRELLRAVIKRSGLSSRRYAVDVLLRDERTIRRWLNGHTSIPPIVVDFLNTENAKP